MEILVTSLLLLGTAAMLALLHIVRPQFRFGWLLAVAGAAGAWLTVLFWIPHLPISLNIPLWQSTASADSYATFLVTGMSWPYALSLTTLALAVVLTAPARTSFPSSSILALFLAVIGLGLLGAAAEGPLTLVMFWAGLDLVEAGVVLARPEGRGAMLNWPVAFALRLGSMALLLLGLVLDQSGDAAAGFAEIQGAGAMLLPAAALIRLAAFAVPSDHISRRDDVQVVLQLTASATAVAFLSQLSPTFQIDPVLLGAACACVAVYAGWMWLRGPDVSVAQPLWLVGMGSLAVAAMLRANPLGATAWGNAMLLAGSALFLATTGERWVNRAVMGALLFCSGLPLTLAAVAWTGRRGLQDLLLPAFLAAQAMMLAGFIQFAGTGYATTPHPAAAPFLRGFYRAGIVLPLVVGMGLGFWGWPGSGQLGAPTATAAAILATAAFVWGKRRIGPLNPSQMHWRPRVVDRLLSAMWHEVGRLQNVLQRVAMTITRTLEGEAGILWSLVVLVLFVSLIANRAH